MIFRANSASLTIHLLLASAMITDAALLGYMSLVQRSDTTSPYKYLRNASDTSLAIRPSGYSASGAMAEPVVPSPSQGWVIRYSTPGCEFSRADQKRWTNLKHALVSRGFRIYEIPPYASDLDRRSVEQDETQIAFVDVDWMKRYRLTGTPTTIVFDKRGHVIWAHVGTMNEDDQKSALWALFWS